MNANLTEIREWRGVKNLVAAKVLTDDNGTDGYTTGTVYSIAGVATISRTTDSSSEAHYYDDMPAVIINGFGADTVTIDTSALPLDVLAWITGQTYDDKLGAMIEGNPEPGYYALGYITEKENGDEVYVWRYKGRFAIPDQSNNTIDNSTNANGNQLVYTGIRTTHKFAANGNEGAKALNVDTSLDLADVSEFFSTVTTPDTLTAK